MYVTWDGDDVGKRKGKRERKQEKKSGSAAPESFRPPQHECLALFLVFYTSGATFHIGINSY